MATIWAATGLAVIMVVLMFGLQLGAAIGARHRAETAADLAALAAAGRSVYGTAAACERAGQIVTEMNGTLTECELTGWEVQVVVRIEQPFLQLSGRVAVGRARAGPVPVIDPAVATSRRTVGRDGWTDGHAGAPK